MHLPILKPCPPSYPFMYRLWLWTLPGYSRQAGEKVSHDHLRSQPMDYLEAKGYRDKYHLMVRHSFSTVLYCSSHSTSFWRRYRHQMVDPVDLLFDASSAIEKGAQS